MFIIRIILALVLVVPGLAQASRAIFYQPQVRDLNVPETNWPIIFNAVRAQGIDTLIVQWTAYGDVLDKPESQAWLKTRLEQAIAAGLKLIIGLHADPELFVRLEQPSKVLGDYFRKQRQLDAQRAQEWLRVLPENKITGWYIPLEIDDRRWRDNAAFDVLNAHIQSETSLLNSIGDKPVFISSFFAGNMSPQRYADMLRRLRINTSVNILLQDGRGTGKLSARERELYLHTLSNCKKTVITGTVFEIFRQTQHDQQFEAQPLSPASLSEILKQQAPCGMTTAFFSLRYMIDLNQPTRR